MKQLGSNISNTMDYKLAAYKQHTTNIYKIKLFKRFLVCFENMDLFHPMTPDNVIVPL